MDRFHTSESKHLAPFGISEKGVTVVGNIILITYILFRICDPIVNHYTYKHIWEHWNDGRIEMIKDYQSIFED